MELSDTGGAPQSEQPHGILGREEDDESGSTSGGTGDTRSAFGVSPRMQDAQQHAQHCEIQRLETMLKGMSRFIGLAPRCLQETLQYVACEGWRGITWKRGYTALHLAAEFGRSDVMPLLVALKADPHSKDNKSRTAYDIATLKGRASCMLPLRLLATCETVADLKAVSLGQHTHPEGPPHGPPGQQLPTPAFAIKGRPSLPLVQQQQQQQQQHPPPHEDSAVACKRLAFAVSEMAKLLSLEPECLVAVQRLASPAEDCSHDDRGYDLEASGALHVAVEHGCYEIMPLLVALSADPNATDSSGTTALQLASGRRQQACVHMLTALAKCSDPHDLQALMFTGELPRGKTGTTRLRTE